MIVIELPTSRMTFSEVLQTALGLSLEGHQEAAEELVKRWAREVKQ
ncbi:MAG: hypothetical protein ACLFT7_05255 [Thermoplasmata archaeon]